MTPEVQKAVEGIQRAFEGSAVQIEDDGSGGAYIIVDGVDLSSKFEPRQTWVGAHLPPQLPYADVYPLFIGAEVSRADRAPFVPPITPGHNFRGRPAIQISRKTNRLDPATQTAASKFLKVLHWLKTVA